VIQRHTRQEKLKERLISYSVVLLSPVAVLLVLHLVIVVAVVHRVDNRISCWHLRLSTSQRRRERRSREGRRSRVSGHRVVQHSLPCAIVKDLRRRDRRQTERVIPLRKGMILPEEIEDAKAGSRVARLWISVGRRVVDLVPRSRIAIRRRAIVRAGFAFVSSTVGSTVVAVYCGDRDDGEVLAVGDNPSAIALE